MKKMAILMCSLVLVFSLAACSNNEPEVTRDDVACQTIADQLLEKVDFESELMSLDERVIANLYDFDSAMVDDFAIYVNATSDTTEEIAVFHAASPENRQVILEMLEGRMANLRATFELYAPREVQRVDNSEILQQGNYLALVVTDDIETAKTVFNDCF